MAYIIKKRKKKDKYSNSLVHCKPKKMYNCAAHYVHIYRYTVRVRNLRTAKIIMFFISLKSGEKKFTMMCIIKLKS